MDKPVLLKKRWLGPGGWLGFRWGAGGRRSRIPAWGRQRGACGFTLLEILVALALIGLLFVAVGGVLERQIGTQRHVEETLAAAQVGWNLMETFHAEGRPLVPDFLEGEEPMAGRSFAWSRQILPMAKPSWYQVSIRVGDADDPQHWERWQGLFP